MKPIRMVVQHDSALIFGVTRQSLYKIKTAASRPPFCRRKDNLSTVPALRKRALSAVLFSVNHPKFFPRECVRYVS